MAAMDILSPTYATIPEHFRALYITPLTTASKLDIEFESVRENLWYLLQITWEFGRKEPLNLELYIRGRDLPSPPSPNIRKDYHIFELTPDIWTKLENNMLMSFQAVLDDIRQHHRGIPFDDHMLVKKLYTSRLSLQDELMCCLGEEIFNKMYTPDNAFSYDKFIKSFDKEITPIFQAIKAEVIDYKLNLTIRDQKLMGYIKGEFSHLYDEQDQLKIENPWSGGSDGVDEYF